MEAGLGEALRSCLHTRVCGHTFRAAVETLKHELGCVAVSLFATPSVAGVSLELLIASFVVLSALLRFVALLLYSVPLHL